jgi:putative hemolysin
LEDLVEELIGDIRDEYDLEEETPTGPLPNGEMEVDGLLNIEDFAEKTDVTLPEGPYETIAGFVMNELGRVPEIGDAVETLGHRFTVTELDGRRIARVRLATLPEEAARLPATPTSGDATRLP